MVVASCEVLIREGRVVETYLVTCAVMEGRACSPWWENCEDLVVVPSWSTSAWSLDLNLVVLCVVKNLLNICVVPLISIMGSIV